MKLNDQRCVIETVDIFNDELQYLMKVGREKEN